MFNGIDTLNGWRTHSIATTLVALYCIRYDDAVAVVDVPCEGPSYDSPWGDWFIYIRAKAKAASLQIGS